MKCETGSENLQLSSRGEKRCDKSSVNPLRFSLDDVIYFSRDDGNETEIREILSTMDEAVEINLENFEKEEDEWTEILDILKRKQEKPVLKRKNNSWKSRKTSNVGKVIFDNDTMTSSK